MTEPPKPPRLKLTHGHAFVFRLLRDAAVARTRCPMASEIDNALDKADIRGGAQVLTNDLWSAGYITTRVYTKNWRVVEIMVGPHKGATSAAPPHRHGPPYIVCTRLPSQPIPTDEPEMPPGDAPPRKRRKDRLKTVPKRSYTTTARPHTPARLPVATSSFIAPLTAKQLMGRR